MVSEERFLRIELKLPGGPDDSVRNAVAALNSRFDPEEMSVLPNPRGLEVLLREVRMEDLAKAVREVSAEHGCAGAMQRIHRSVAGVRSFGVRGRKRQFVGYKKERKVSGRKEKEIRRGKHFYADGDSHSRKANPFPAEMADRIVCGDSEEVLRRLPDNCVDLVFTSPPYNFGLDYGVGADDRDWQSYFDKLFAVLSECVRVLKHGGRLAVNVQPLFSDCIPSHHIISSFLMERKMIWKGEILWEKHNYNCKYSAWGSWKSPSSPYLKYTWEFVEVFCKGSLKKPGNPERADIDAESFKKWVNAKWSIAPERKMREMGHPAMFPVELARRMLLLFSFRGDVVLDPFAGLGTTCVAAKKCGRGYLGIDVSEEYCEKSEERLRQVQASFL